ncbi:hypothetical protein SERLADRAFT_434241 [Serpula lacrymans var. lacrymans S7.9]|uniref:Uncharacterized protein n=1 Tax=Serpula lacrymans var. lacrymans (strain S7.9) TaxID=578457 RepID=F8NK72_SERL9|nr:uncharacterized protein SERLADRAFT_434241 [Serpula lacrymans var. lacrymans S7.9]EGO28338.1 hypothetical protein SERLADRAFT_434241 [Serpula lacrymans var. lacrymans S7.9]
MEAARLKKEEEEKAQMSEAMKMTREWKVQPVKCRPPTTQKENIPLLGTSQFKSDMKVTAASFCPFRPHVIAVIPSVPYCLASDKIDGSIGDNALRHIFGTFGGTTVNFDMNLRVNASPEGSLQTGGGDVQTRKLRCLKLEDEVFNEEAGKALLRYVFGGAFCEVLDPPQLILKYLSYATK